MGSLVGATEIEQREGLGRTTTRSAGSGAGGTDRQACCRVPAPRARCCTSPCRSSGRSGSSARSAWRTACGTSRRRSARSTSDRRRRAGDGRHRRRAFGRFASAITTPDPLSHGTRGLAAASWTRSWISRHVARSASWSRRSTRQRRASTNTRSRAGVRLGRLPRAGPRARCRRPPRRCSGGPTASRPLRERLVTGLVGHTRRLGRLADDLLELARLEGGRLAIERAPVSLVGLAQQAVAEWTAEASWRHVTLELVADGAPLAYGDHERLVQAAGNLVENALKHTPRDGSVGAGLVRPRGTTWRSTTRARASRREDLPFIFHRFYRWKGDRAAADRDGPRPGDRRADRAGARRRGQRDQRARRGQRLPSRLHTPRA